MLSSSTSPLFSKGNLVAVLDAHLRSIEDRVNKIPRDQFMISSEDGIVAHVLPHMLVEPIELDEESAVTVIEQIYKDYYEFIEA